MIKFISTSVIIGAIALEGYYLYFLSQKQEFSSFLFPFLVLATMALVAHGIEGIIGSFWAKKQGKNAWNYGIYVFFTGTISLIELWQNKDNGDIT